MDAQGTVNLTVENSEASWEDLIRDLLEGDLGPTEDLGLSGKRGPINSVRPCTCWSCGGGCDGC